MELPDYDDYGRLENKIDKIANKLSKLIDCLDIPKKYVIGTMEFSSRENAEKWDNERIRRIYNDNIGTTGCVPHSNIDVIPSID